MHYCCCRYGLIIPSKAAKSKAVVNPVSVFGNDDDDDDDQVCKDGLNLLCKYMVADYELFLHRFLLRY